MFDRPGRNWKKLQLDGLQGLRISGLDGLCHSLNHGVIAPDSPRIKIIAKQPDDVVETLVALAYIRAVRPGAGYAIIQKRLKPLSAGRRAYTAGVDGIEKNHQSMICRRRNRFVGTMKVCFVRFRKIVVRVICAAGGIPGKRANAIRSAAVFAAVVICRARDKQIHPHGIEPVSLSVREVALRIFYRTHPNQSMRIVSGNQERNVVLIHQIPPIGADFEWIGRRRCAGRSVWRRANLTRRPAKSQQREHLHQSSRPWMEIAPKAHHLHFFFMPPHARTSRPICFRRV